MTDVTTEAVGVVQYRAELDARVELANGGHLSVERFLLDVPGPDVAEGEVAALLVATLGLSMTKEVRVSRLRILPEAHKGTGAGPSDGAPGPSGPCRLVELSHVVEHGMTTYPGLPGPEITPYLTREASRANYGAGTEFAIDRITLVGNTGTYLDTPYHRYADGTDLGGLGLESVAYLPAVVVRVVGATERGVGVGALVPFDVAGKAVLLHTGGDRDWGTPAYADEAPYLTAAGARWLADQGAALVGIDSANIDDIGDPARPAHTVLLAAGIPIVEHLTALDQLPPHGARFTAAPPRIARFGTFPVRAFALV